MAYRYHMNASSIGSSRSGGKSGKSSTVQVGRVVHVVLDSNDPHYKDSSMINGVFYRMLTVPTDEVNVDGLPFAPQGNCTIRQIPLPGEIVYLEPGPSFKTLGSPTVTSLYWTGIVNIWNHPHHNAAPDTKQLEWKESLLGGFSEDKTVSPLKANPGDTLLEGRQGQSIRFGGNKGTALNYIDGLNSGKPVVIISNGQVVTGSGSKLVEENINEDNNSIYLLSDHKVPLQSANDKRDSYTEVPTVPDQYRGNQIIVNAGRLYFNAKNESAFISAKKSIGMNANTLNFDGKEYICLDAGKIYLGKAARTSPSETREPLILGNQFENWINALLDSLRDVATAMASASSVSGGPVTNLNVAGPGLEAAIRSLKTRIKQFKSNKVFTE